MTGDVHGSNSSLCCGSRRAGRGGRINWSRWEKRRREREPSWAAPVQKPKSALCLLPEGEETRHPRVDSGHSEAGRAAPNGESCLEPSRRPGTRRRDGVGVERRSCLVSHPSILSHSHPHFVQVSLCPSNLPLRQSKRPGFLSRHIPPAFYP